METNFKIKTKKHRSRLQLDLEGVFDGSSAYALARCIERESLDNSMSVHIETKGISEVLPFGREVLDKTIPKWDRKRLHFKGQCACDIAPEGCTLSAAKKRHGHKCTGNCPNCKCRKAAGSRVLN